jgi:hypothetical protein
VHERFVREVVEDLGLCPFARRSRELGRVHRPILRAGDSETDPARSAAALAEIARTHADAEIVLLTYPVPDTHAWAEYRRFDVFVGRVRDAYAALGPGPVFYMVGFHPAFGDVDPERVGPESLVPLLRRTPDPVIQCVRAETLDAVRRQAQSVARERMQRELHARDPALALLFERSIQPDPELSADIARHNFETVGRGAGRAELERRIADIRRDRDRAYGGRS